mmetsp:Transcript_83814/g.270931  ORF Transcript_83814/g.270931 Transcript_83814/m.270931 type:complete len:213 (-) Transcript_83814:428-1066(-)
MRNGAANPRTFQYPVVNFGLLNRPGNDRQNPSSWAKRAAPSVASSRTASQREGRSTDEAEELTAPPFAASASSPSPSSSPPLRGSGNSPTASPTAAATSSATSKASRAKLLHWPGNRRRPTGSKITGGRFESSGPTSNSGHSSPASPSGPPGEASPRPQAAKATSRASRAEARRGPCAAACVATCSKRSRSHSSGTRAAARPCREPTKICAS